MSKDFHAVWSNILSSLEILFRINLEQKKSIFHLLRQLNVECKMEFNSTQNAKAWELIFNIQDRRHFAQANLVITIN